MALRVLQFFATLGNGGAENRMMDVYRRINTDVVQFDFAVLHEGEHYFDEEVKDMGAVKYVFPDPRAGLLKNYRSLVSFFRKHPFQAVHTHVSWYGGVVLMAAKRAGISNRIAHARAAATANRGLKESLFCNLGKILISMSATQRMAISQEAARNIYGSRVVKKRKYLYVPNALNQEKYVVLEGKKRAELRERLGIPSDKKAYVTVANFRKPKNHTFLLDVVKALREEKDDFILYLIGDGDLRSEIVEKISKLGIENNVVLMGTRGDVPEILCAFDGMIFPSLNEGLGGVVLEAQLVGLPAIVSDAIPKEVDVGLDMIEFLPVSAGPSAWAKVIGRKTSDFVWDRQKALRAFKDTGYCIEETAKRYLREYGLAEDLIEKAIEK